MKRKVTVNQVRAGWEPIGMPRRTNQGTRQRALKAANQLFERREAQ